MGKKTNVAALQKTISASTAPMALFTQPPASAPGKENKFPYRLSNTAKSVGQLLRNDHALLLENALLDTTLPIALNIPPHLRASGDAGSYIVQSRSAIDDEFRARLREAGASNTAPARLNISLRL